MAKKWMQEAFSRHPGAFKKKAAAAGKGTMEFAEEKEDAPGRTGKQARLALIGRKYGGGGGGGGKKKESAADQAAALRH